MTQEINRNTTAIDPELLKVNTPSAGENLVVAAQAAGELALDFDPSQLADVARSGDDLVFTFENGGAATISGFFSAAAQGEMTFALPDGAAVSAKDFLATFDIEMPDTAAGPAAGAAGSGSGEYRSDPGAFTDGVDRLGDQGSFYWGRSPDVDRDDQGGVPGLDIGVGPLFLSAENFNESGEGLTLGLNLTFPAPGPITVFIRVGDGVNEVGGGVNILENGSPEFMADISLPGGAVPGGSWSYDPSTGLLTIIIDAGSSGVTIPISTFDDHISEGPESLTFSIVGTEGPVTGGTGQSATVNFVEDGAREIGDPLYGELDGPIVGVTIVGDKDSTYEGAPGSHERDMPMLQKRDAPELEYDGNTFTVAVTLTDPHSNAPYWGYHDSQGVDSMDLSQDMTITLKVGSGGAVYGEDYEFSAASLDALRAIDGVESVTVNDDGAVTIKLNGRVDAEGNLYTDAEHKVFDLNNVDNLTLDIKVLINSTEASESDELFTVYVAETSGNESQPAGAGESAEFTIEADPKLSLTIGVDSVQESAGGDQMQPTSIDFRPEPAAARSEFPVTLTFDKEIGDEVTFKATLNVGGEATLWNGVAADMYKADYFLPGSFDKNGQLAVTATADGYYTTVRINGEVVTFTYDSATGSVTVSGAGAAFADLSGSGNWEISFNFIINDDHIGNGTDAGGDYNETIVLSLGNVVLDDGYSGYESTDNVSGQPTGGGVSWDGAADSVVITDDTERADGDRWPEVTEKDGPIFGVTVDSSGLEEWKDGAAGAAGKEGAVTVNINLTNPHGGGVYTGYPGASAGAGAHNAMSQTTTVTVTLDVTGMDFGNYTSHADAQTAKADFWLDMSALDDLASLGVTYTLTPDGDKLVLELILPEGFPLTDANLAALNFQIKMANDDASERQEQSITVTIATDGMNESLDDGQERVITVTEGDYTGPVLSLVSPETITESKLPDDLNAPYAPTDNTATHSITLDKPGVETIGVLVTLTGGTNTLLQGVTGVDDADADFAFSGVVTAFTGETDATGTALTAITLVEFKAGVDGYYYNEETGQLYVNIPAGYTKVDFEVTIIDDLRENPSEAGENYTVKLELISSDVDGNIEGLDGAYDPTTGMPGSEARLAGDVSSITENTEIVEDARIGDGIDPLNPATFDGPFVHVSADKTSVNEQDGDTNITYTIHLTDPQGENTAYTDAVEKITVKLAIRPTDAAADSTFTPFDIFKPGTGDDVVAANQVTIDGATYYVQVSASGFDASGQPTGYSMAMYKGPGFENPVSAADGVDIKYNTVTGQMELTVTVTPPASDVDFTLPVNDDPLGAYPGSAYDQPNESFTVEIIDVLGNEARVDNSTDRPSSAEVTIVDDNADNGTDTLEGVTVGLEWTTQTYGDNLLAEGQNYNLAIKLYGNDGKALGGTNNPYAGYSVGIVKGSTILPENMTVSLNLTNTPGNDVVFALGGLKTLLSNGDITITVGETEYTTLTAYQAVYGDTISGEVTITIKSGAFTLMDLSNLYVQVKVLGDNVNEYEKESSYEYADNVAGSTADALGPEGIKAEITDVSGNESSIKAGGESVWSDITDMANGVLTLNGIDTNADDGAWNFKISVTYKDDEGNWNNGANKALPGETVHMQIQITDSAIMQNGQEYNVSAYSLFLSLNKIDGSVVSEDDYYAYLAGKTAADLMNPADTAPDWAKTLIIVSDPNATVDGDVWDASGDNASNIYDIIVPADKWPASGELNFEIAKGDHLGSTTDGFTVQLLDPYDDASPAYDIKGEIIDAKGSVTVESSDHLFLSLKGDKTIYEDSDMGETERTYTVEFNSYGAVDGKGCPLGAETTPKDDPATSDVNEGSFYAAGDISFKLTFIPNNGLVFDDNLADNAYLDNWVGGTADNGGHGTGDVGIAIYDGEGNYVDYTSLNDNSDATSLFNLLQAQFDDKYGEGTVTLNGISMTNGQLVFDLTVKEGFDLSQGLDITFRALDDSINDNSELFKVVLSDVRTDDGVSAGITGDRAGKTTIVDETADAYIEYRNGFAISLEDSSGYEANLTGAGIDGKHVFVTVRAYALDDDSNTPVSLAELDSRYAAYQDLNPGYTGDLASFIKTYYAPTQPITVNYNLEDVHTEAGADYMVSSSHIIKSGDWELVIDAENGLVYFEASGKNGIPIETVKDLASEGEESLTITLTSTSGNESRPIVSDDGIDGGEKSANVTILDLHDGVFIISISPAGYQAVEPVDRDHGPEKTTTTTEEFAYYADKYELTVQDNATKDCAVAAFPAIGDAWSYGEDYIFGEGTYYYDAETQSIYALGSDGLYTGSPLAPADLGLSDDFVSLAGQKGLEGYFVIIDKEANTADINIKMLKEDAGLDELTLSFKKKDSFVGEHTGNPFEGDLPLTVQERVTMETQHTVYSGTQHVADPNSIEFTLQLSEAAFEDMIVWIDPTAGSAAYGDDFTLGKGVYVSNGDGTCYELSDPDTILNVSDLVGLNGQLPGYYSDLGAGNYFVVVKQGEAAVKFEVKILDDNDTANDRGEDLLDLENIVIDVLAVQGSEACVQTDDGLIPWDAEQSYVYTFHDGSDAYKGIVDPAAGTFTYTKNGQEVVVHFDDADKPAWLPGSAPNAAEYVKGEYTTAIQDDMEGPEVSFATDGNNTIAWSNGNDADNPNPINLTLNVEDYCSESVTVTVKVIGLTGVESFDVDIPKDALSEGFNLRDYLPDGYTLPSRDFYLQISVTEGGETLWDGEPVFMRNTDGGGTAPVRTIDDFESKPINETWNNAAADKDYASYTFTVGNITDETNTGDVKFTVNFLSGSADEGDLFEDFTSVTVTIPSGFLERFEASGGSAGFEIRADEDGNAALYHNDAKVDGATVLDAGGNPVELPATYIDNKIEGDEEFYAVITDVSGADLLDGVATTEVVDQTYAQIILFDRDGNPLGATHTFTEGQDPSETGLVAKLVLVNEAGQPVDANGNRVTDDNGDLLDGKSYEFVTCAKAVEFKISYTDGSAAENADYSGDSVFYIPAGESSADIQLQIHEDMTTEGTEDFTISISNSDRAAVLYPEISGHITSGNAQTIEIEEHLNGPVIKWGSSQSDYSTNSVNMDEGGSGHTVHFGSYARAGESTDAENIRQVVEENVSLTFTLTPNNDLDMGGDIKAIVLTGLDGQSYTFTFNADGSVNAPAGVDAAKLAAAGVNVELDGDAYVITAAMPKGSATGSFKIVPQDDVISELDDKFELQLTGTSGSETDIAAGWTATQTVTIKDDADGYKVGVEALPGTEGETAGVLITLGNGLAPQESVTFTLDVTDADGVISEQGVITVTLPNGDVVEFNVANGAIVSYGGETDGTTWPAELPALTWSNGELTLTVPPAQMALANGSKGVEVQFPLQDNSVLDDAKAFEVTVSHQGGEMGDANAPAYASAFEGENQPGGGHGGQTLLSLINEGGNVNSVVGSNTLIFSGGDDLSVIRSITIGDQTYDSSQFTLSDDKKTITIADVKIEDGYDITVTYESGADASDVKTKLDVRVTVDSTLGASVTVSDDTGATDAITLSVAFDSNTAVEGGELAGAFHIAGGNLEGDPNTVSGAVSFQFQASKNPDGSYNTITLDNNTDYTLSGPGTDGIYTVTLNDTASLPAEIGFTVTVADNSLAENPDYAITLVDGSFTAGNYENPVIDTTDNSASVSITNNDTDPSGPIWTVVGTDAAEGGELSFVISSGGDAWDDVAATGSVRVYFKIDGLLGTDTVSGATWDETSQRYYVDITAGTKSGTVTVITADNAVVDTDREVTLTIISDNTFEQNTGAEGAATLTDDADGFTLGISGKQDDNSNTMTFALALAAAGDFFEENAAIGSEITFNLNLAGFNADQLSEILTALNDYDAGVSAGLDNNTITVTLSADYVYDSANPISFTVNAGEGADGVDQNYSVSIDVNTLTSSPALEFLEVAANEYTAAVTVDLTIGSSEATDAQLLYGGDGNDTIYGGAGGDTIYGGDGNDTIYAGGGINTIYGGDGDDTIYAGVGEDTITGGDGSDIFIWETGDMSAVADMIMDFELNEDRIDLEGILGSDVKNLINSGGFNEDDPSKFEAGDLKALFSDTGVTLEVTHEGLTQTIEVAFDGGNYINPADDDAARAILVQILTNS